ncbi:hypothetical protein H6F61_21485 [Cyanobacteria bacterium FACHB-472]|nr:hypothetical protein [Cyanobacteria bacterium FACHB-472]
MTQALPKAIALEDFLEWKLEIGRYKLHNGVIQIFKIGVLSEQQQNES